MRIFHILPIFSLLVGIRASSLDSRRPDAHPLDARDVSDVCALLTPDESDFGLYLGLFFSDAYGDCLCVSGVSQFLKGDPVDTASDLTNYIIDNAPTNCNYPANSVPACVDSNPCGFTCTAGNTPYPTDNPTMCGCPAPNIVCNGNCVAANACPSSQATTPQKRWVGSGSCTEMGHGWAACGVFGGGARAWECVNTARDLESCGGCVLPLTPFSRIGQDCTALPGVADVSCLSGECVVHRCMSGYSLSRDGTHCVSAQAHISHPHVAVPEDDDDEYMQALRYALEHRPL
ncbi:hypothetical protein V8E53_007088 [Lactarius tabidus]